MNNITVTNAVHFSGLKLFITFSDGKHQTVDFSEFLNRHSTPEYLKEYSTEEKIKEFKIEDGNIVWGLDWDLIFPIEQLYNGKIL